MDTASLYDRLQGYDWGDITKKLTAFVAKYTYYRHGIKGNDLPQGHQPVDIAQEAIKKVIDGERIWNPENDPDLLKFLQFSVCQSLISNLFTLWDSRKIVAASYISKNQQPSDSNRPVIPLPDTECTEIDSDIEQSIDNNHLLEKLSQLLSNDSDAQDVLLLMLEGKQTRHISEELKVDQRTVENAKKRIYRAVSKLPRP